MVFTKEQKKKLIIEFKKRQKEKIEKFKENVELCSMRCEKNILRRLNKVSVTLWNIRIKDVLELERYKKPIIRSLFKDIQELKIKYEKEQVKFDKELLRLRGETVVGDNKDKIP